MPLHRPVLPLAAVVALSALLLGGCAPPPPAPPTPTPAFASEAEAFAAAEEVYRAYNEAGNQRSDDERFLTGEALSSDLDSKRVLSENGLQILGASEVVSFKGTHADLEGAVSRVSAEVCLDITSSRVTDAHGTDVTPQDRVNRWLLEIDFVGKPSEMLIADSSPVEDETC